MFSLPTRIRNVPVHSSLVSFIFGGLVLLTIPPVSLAQSPPEEIRTIVSDDFINNRPKPRYTGKSANSSGELRDDSLPRRRRTYRLASSDSAGSSSHSRFTTSAVRQLGLTVWKLRRTSEGWTAERAEADTKFQNGDYLRISIESPLSGYLYVIDRDWFANGDFGDTNLIFPFRDEDNRLDPGKLVDIPAENQSPFQASPKANQAGEMLTILVTSKPLRLPISTSPIPISRSQLSGWESAWGVTSLRFEMDGGAGEARTKHEKEAAAPKGTRQLTRADPGPQTIYLLSPKNNEAFLINVTLSYSR